MDGGAWRATVPRVAKNQTQLKQLSIHACMHLCVYKQACMHAHVCVCLLCLALLQEPRDGMELTSFLAAWV